MMTMTWDEMRTLPITTADIVRARAAGACKEALRWAAAAPRTWGDARPEWIGWYGRYAATPAQLDACIAGTNAERRGRIGEYRTDLTPAQLDACIAGTNAERRGRIGACRDDLTPAQLTACIAGTTPYWRGVIGAARRSDAGAARGV
ncbi:MAG: hypothetical protein JETCAE02_27000 [Anaerolineaceae bacterium]|nr:MAG: hypothetical protein JETCAE02_27000 [Anaerolineaceae bacterium]